MNPMECLRWMLIRRLPRRSDIGLGGKCCFGIHPRRSSANNLPARSIHRKKAVSRKCIYLYSQLTVFLESRFLGEYACHLEQVACVGGVAAAGADLEVEVDLVVFFVSED